MILVDVNLLVYATVEEFAQHERARVWLEERLKGPYGVALPWPTLTGFVRIVCNPRILGRPMPLERAWEQVEEWLALEVTFTPEPTARHGEILETLLPAVGNRANLVPDAHLAALAVEYGLTLCSTDADFARFPGLRWENPLATGVAGRATGRTVVSRRRGGRDVVRAREVRARLSLSPEL